jgi:hypothetical protein
VSTLDITVGEGGFPLSFYDPSSRKVRAGLTLYQSPSVRVATGPRQNQVIL